MKRKAGKTMKDRIREALRRLSGRSIKAVIFDLDDTLWDTTGQLVKKGQIAALKEMARLGLPIKQSEAAKTRDILVRKYGGHINITKKAIEHFGLKSCDRGNERERTEKIRLAGHNKYHNVSMGDIKPFRGTIPLLKKLKKEGRTLVLLSYGNRRQQENKLDKLGLRKYFDRLVFDTSIGQPDKLPHIKDIIGWLKKKGISKGEILLVGDKITSEIEAGNRLGLRTVRLLKGRYSGLKPANRRQKPDSEIRRIEELEEII